MYINLAQAEAGKYNPDFQDPAIFADPAYIKGDPDFTVDPRFDLFPDGGPQYVKDPVFVKGDQQPVPPVYVDAGGQVLTVQNNDGGTQVKIDPAPPTGNPKTKKILTIAGVAILAYFLFKK